MNVWGKVALGVFGGLVCLAGVGWLGLQVQPTNLPPPDDKPNDLGAVAIPSSMPGPVRRYFQTTIGNEVPLISSLVVYGRARANFGFWMPLRYRLVHHPGYAFERYMEVTWFGMPILKAVDRYIEGVGMTGPLSNLSKGPATDQGANMILWVEAPLMPSLWITDPRIRWEQIDERSARLIFPFGEEEDEVIVHFDPQSSLITHIRAMRYRDAESGKIPWRADFLEWQTKEGITLPSRIAITWEDQGEPWSYWDLEEYFWNVGISGLSTKSGEAQTTRVVE